MSYQKLQNGTYIIAGWENGIARSPLYGHGQMVNVDIFTKPGSALIQKSADNVISGMAANGKWFAQNPLNGDIYFIDGAGVLRVSTNGGASWSTVGGTPANNGNGLAVWVSPNSFSATPEAFVFVAGNDQLHVYDITATTWDAGAFPLALEATSKDHPMSVGLDNILYIGNRQFVATFEEVLGSTFDPANAATYTFNDAALDVPAYYDITTLTNFGQNLLCGAEGDDEGTDCQIFPWDRTSDSFSIPIQVYDNRINQLYTKNNLVYINSGSKCIIRNFNGSLVSPLHEWFNLASQNSLTGAAGAMTSLEEEILIGVGSTASGRNPLGVYSSREGVLCLRNIISTGSDGTSTALQIGALYPLPNEKYLVAWRSGSPATYGVDLINDDGNYYTGYAAYIETDLIPVGTFITPVNFGQIEFKLGKPLVSGQGIRIAYRENLADAFTTIGTWDFATIGSRLSYNAQANIFNAEWVQLKISLTTGSPNSDETPELVEVRLIP